MASNQTQEQSPPLTEESYCPTHSDIEFGTDSDPKTHSDLDIAAGVGAASSKSYPSPEATYEEVVESAQLFSDELKAFHSSFLDTEIRFPTLGGKELDLHRLFVEVTSRGGLEKVISDRKWKEVISALYLPSVVNNASFVVRKHYMSLLYHFEQAYYLRRRGPAISLEATKSESPVTGLEFPPESAAAAGQSPANPILQPGFSVIGTIEEKCDYGYIISVNSGSEQMKGILYHIPNMSPMSGHVETSIVQHQKQ